MVYEYNIYDRYGKLMLLAGMIHVNIGIARCFLVHCKVTPPSLLVEYSTRAGTQVTEANRKEAARPLSPFTGTSGPLLPCFQQIFNMLQEMWVGGCATF